MPSVLNVDTLVAANGTDPVTLTKQSAAKVLWDLNGQGTIALQASFNVSSAADLGTGFYQINYTNAFDTGNNMPLSHVLNVVSFDSTLTGAKTASYASFYTMRSTDGNLQDTFPFGATHGDLA